MYKDTSVTLHTGKKEEYFEYRVGVKHGDPMDPVIFLFAIQEACQVTKKHIKTNSSY